MKAIRSRFVLLSNRSTDAGVGIVEVIFAFAIFMIVSIGITFSTVTTLRLSADSKSREVAANLAASEIDNARANGDPLTLYPNTRTIVVDNTTYTIVRTAGWVSATGSSSGCGTGTGALQYKQVGVKVSWDGQLSTTAPVQSNTLIAPITRLNDPSYGTILVSVLNAAGTGTQGIPVVVTATNAGAPVTMDATDVEGCSYAFKVTPGTYKVAISKSNYIDAVQVAAPTKSVTITAGSTVSASFQYDLAATFNMKYASNQAAPTKLYPSNLDTTFISTYGTYQINSGTPTQLQLHPFSSGYSVIAGKYVTPIPANPPAAAVPGCLSPDPTSWTAGTVGGVALQAGQRLPAVAASPGGSAIMNVPMGLITFTYTGNSGRYVVAKTATAPASAGDPGCDVAMTYTFSQVLTKNSSYSLALPYGSWSLSTSASNTGSGTLTSITDSLLGNILGTPSSSIITLDPRTP